MFDPHVPHGAPSTPVHPFDLDARTSLEALRLDAGVIHRRLRRIADHAAFGGTPQVEDLDRVAEAVASLHRRILEITSEDASASLADVVAARHSIHRSLELVHEVAGDVLAG